MSLPVGMCKTCKFWDGDELGRGRCHRFPPISGVRFQSSCSNWTAEGFPFVSHDEWCGEYQKQDPSHD